jgi:hypothetical protein
MHVLFMAVMVDEHLFNDRRLPQSVARNRHVPRSRSIK